VLSQQIIIEDDGLRKQAIIEAFGRAASDYDQHAAFQRQVGHLLLDKLAPDLSGLRVLDLGCGTGYFSYQLAKRGATVIAADISKPMLAQCQKRCTGMSVITLEADAEALPFEAGEFDLAFSSLALQWCQDLSVPLQEMKRVVKPSGQIMFSTLLDGSLVELKKAWSKIDSYQHVNNFLSQKQVKLALAQSGNSSHHLDSSPVTLWYRTAFELMRDLKGIGATHVTGRNNGLTTRQQLRGVDKEYQKFRNHQGLLPATYQVCLGVITS